MTAVDVPQHEKFKQERVRLETIRDFLEWWMHDSDLHDYEPELRDALSNLTDRQKERWIFEFIGLDQDAFHNEKDAMVRQLQEEARRGAKK